MSASFSNPAAHATVVSPSDTANLAHPAASLLLFNIVATTTVPATITITTVGGDTLTITLAPSPASGTTVVPFINLPIQVGKVFAAARRGSLPSWRYGNDGKGPRVACVVVALAGVPVRPALVHRPDFRPPRRPRRASIWPSYFEAKISRLMAMNTPEQEAAFAEVWMASIPLEHRAKKRWPPPPPMLQKQIKVAAMETAAASCPEPEPETRNEIAVIMDEINETPPLAPPAPERPKRRHWSEEQKRAAVAATLEPGATVSAVARKHGIQPQSLRGLAEALRKRRSRQGRPGRQRQGPRGPGRHRRR